MPSLWLCRSGKHVAEVEVGGQAMEDFPRKEAPAISIFHTAGILSERVVYLGTNFTSILTRVKNYTFDFHVGMV